MKVIGIDLLTNGYAWLGAVAAWQQDLDYWIKIAAGVSAIIVSWVTIYLKLRKKDNSDK